MPADHAIEARGLRKQFGAKVAVADLSLLVRRGEIFGFLGPNGAGKTTSLKMLLALVEPSGGEAMVLGAPLGDRLARARIGFLPEHFRFHDCLTGRELLRVHGRLYGLRGRPLEHQIDALMSRVDLWDAADQPIGQYSKGMLQRVGLAQALLNEPELVLLDEPTSGLDPLGRLLVRDLLRDLRARGTAVFLNSHLLGEVEATCDRVVFVKQGRIVHELTLGESSSDLDVELRIDLPADRLRPTFAHGASAGRQGFGGQEAGSHEEIIQGLARFGTAPVQANGVVHLRVESEASLPPLVRWLVERGVSVYGIQSRRKSLEQWFVEVMGDDQRPG